MIPTFIRSYEANSELEGYRIAMFSDATASQMVAHATGSDVPLVGAVDRMGADTGGMADIHRGGVVSVQLGADVAAGDPLTADADGFAIKAAPAAGTNANIIGFADAPGVAGDIIDALFAPGVIQG